MKEMVSCPVCLNLQGGNCISIINGSRDTWSIECDVCGDYEVTHEAFEDWLNPERGDFTSMQRAVLSHRLRTATRESGPLDHFESENGLPSPAVQAINIIRYVGDEVLRSGEPIPHLPVELSAIIGSPNREFAARLAKELYEQGTLSGIDTSSMDGTDLMDINLTLNGWEHYEAEKGGRVAGRYGFIAMDFGDTVLDPFVRDVVKPAVKEGIGYELVDMRDVARAGIIDNIMRSQIRDAAFVIVDLTHDNSGAYWEAGYAEGLGKPVIYICEREKFEDARTHFDTNHCTTVLWSQERAEDFSQDLIATLRRSLNLFPDAA